MDQLKIIFFGSTSDSVLVLERLHKLVIGQLSLEIVTVVTQPPRPVGRGQVITPTPVEIWTKKNHIPVLSFATNPDKPWFYQNEQQVVDTLQPFKADLLVSASYGQKIPTSTINSTKFGGLNVHPSLLPRWRGADPVPWAILMGDHQSGVTLVTLADKFDQGKIIAQKKVALTEKDTSDPLRTKLFKLGANLLTESLHDYLRLFRHSGLEPESSSRTLDSRFRGNDNVNSSLPYARRLTRDDGFIPWKLLQQAMLGKHVVSARRPSMLSFGIGNLSFDIARLHRALAPWPGLWTKVMINGGEKRLKILSLSLQPTTNNLQLDSVQLEGKKPVSFEQFSADHIF